MSGDRQDPKQIDAFRALARRLADEQSDLKFKDALRRLMSPSADAAESLNGSSPHEEPVKQRNQAVKA